MIYSQRELLAKYVVDYLQDKTIVPYQAIPVVDEQTGIRGFLVKENVPLEYGALSITPRKENK